MSIVAKINLFFLKYEVGRLDDNSQIIKKLNSKKKILLIRKLIDSLKIIYNEEILHIKKGDKWFKYLCDKDNLDYNIYFKILEKYKLKDDYRLDIDVSRKKEREFGYGEIKKLADIECN